MISITMEKLKTLQTTVWKHIEAQAEHIHSVVSKYQAEGKTVVRIKGSIHKVNKEILKANGFTVIEHCFDYTSGEPCYEISWIAIV